MKNNIDKKKDNYQLSILFILIASFSFAFVPIIIKSLKNIPLMEVVFFRSFVAMLIIPFILFWWKIPIYGNNKTLLLLRGLFGYLGTLGMYYAYTKLLITDAVTIHRLSPFFIMILSVIILKEKISFKHIYIIFTAFFGALLIIKPGFRADILPAIIALIATLFVSVSHIILRQLRLSDHFLVIINYFSYISGLLSIFFLIIQGNFVFPKYSDLIKLLLLGSITIGAQLGLTLAYKYAPASKISPYLYTQIFFAAILEVVFFGIFSDFLTYIGASIIVLTGIINYYYNRNRK